MPPAPELRDRAGEEGRAEILHQPEAHHPGRAHRHVGVAGEVTVELDGEGRCGAYELKRAIVAGGGEYRAHQHGQPVGQDRLLESAPEEADQAHPEVVVVEWVLLPTLGEEVPGPVNGTGDQLREEGDEEGIGHKAPLGRNFAPVDVHNVARRLEQVKGDAHGENEVQGGGGEIKADGVQGPAGQSQGEV